jgi:hypothetical protein
MCLFLFVFCTLSQLHPDCVSTSWSWANKFRGTAAAPLALFAAVLLAVFAKILRFLWSRYIGRRLLKRFPARNCMHHELNCSPYDVCLKCRAMGFKPSFGIIGPPPGGLKASKRIPATIRMKIGRALTAPVTWEDVVKTIRTAVRSYLTILKVAYLFLAGGAIEYWNCNKDRVRKEKGARVFFTSPSRPVFTLHLGYYCTWPPTRPSPASHCFFFSFSFFSTVPP